MSIGGWLGERIGGGDRPAAAVAGGPSLARVFGWVLLLLVLVEGVTGAALAAFYAPSATDAWASVAYVQDRMPLGWLVRGLHYHGASALVIVTGIHLVQTAIWGAYRKPRELTWWLGIVLLLLVLGFAISGYVLRWDQAGYWANRVEIGIAAGTPVIGPAIRALAIGGNDYGNLTLTRFHALHVVVLPALFGIVTVFHLALVRHHGPTPHWRKEGAAATPRWPAQTFRDVVAMAIAFAVLLGFVISQHGAALAGPADPSAAYDARPLWYFRWLFELRHLAGSAEELAALAAPGIVMGFLVALPLVDRGPDRAPSKRLLFVGGIAGLFAVVGVLTMMSIAADSGDDDLAKREHAAAQWAGRARAIAAQYGVPATGPQDLLTMLPMYRARSLYTQRCKSCHDAGSKDRKGPIIAPGHGTRGWLEAFLKAPGSEPYWGKTKLAATDDAMKAVELSQGDLSDLVEALYAQSGAADVDAAKRDRGKVIYDKACNDCHSIEEGVAGTSGPGLGGLGSRDWYTTFIGNPKAPVHMGPDHSQMPRFDRDLSIVDRDALAGYLMWLRTHSQRDLDALGPL